MINYFHPEYNKYFEETSKPFFVLNFTKYSQLDPVERLFYLLDPKFNALIKDLDKKPQRNGASGSMIFTQNDCNCIYKAILNGENENSVKKKIMIATHPDKQSDQRKQILDRIWLEMQKNCSP